MTAAYVGTETLVGAGDLQCPGVGVGCRLDKMRLARTDRTQFEVALCLRHSESTSSLYDMPAGRLQEEFSRLHPVLVAVSSAIDCGALVATADRPLRHDHCIGSSLAPVNPCLSKPLFLNHSSYMVFS